jgi:hypothetical protein
VIAHVAGAPVEEALLPLLGGVGTGLVLARAWVASRVQRRPGHDRSAEAAAPPDAGRPLV